jgi:hypothetical protein
MQISFNNDEAWESQSTAGETFTRKGRAKPVDIVLLAAQIKQIEKRLANLEVAVHGPKILNDDSGESIEVYPENLLPLQKFEAAHAADALATIDHNLITSRPHNQGICSQIRDNFMLLRQYNFAVFQFIVMLLAIFGLMSMTAIKFIDAHDSVNDDYKPFKVDGKDEYYRNENLQYELPLHYFWVQFSISKLNFSTAYNETFNETCENALLECLWRYLHDALDPELALPTELPTVAPSATPIFDPTSSPSNNPVMYPTTELMNSNGSSLWWDMVMTPSPIISIEEEVIFDMPELWHNESTINSPISAKCIMITSENGTVTTESVGLRNLSLYLDEFGVTVGFNDSDAMSIFGLLIRLEFKNFDGYMSGRVMCDLFRYGTA